MSKGAEGMCRDPEKIPVQTARWGIVGDTAGGGDREDMNVRKSGLHCGEHSEILLTLDQKESACRIHLP